MSAYFAACKLPWQRASFFVCCCLCSNTCWSRLSSGFLQTLAWTGQGSSLTTCPTKATASCTPRTPHRALAWWPHPASLSIGSLLKDWVVITWGLILMLPTHDQLETSLSDGSLVLQVLLLFLSPWDPASIPILILQLTRKTSSTAMEITAIELEHVLCLGCETVNKHPGDFTFTTMLAQLTMNLLSTLLWEDRESQDAKKSNFS